MIDYYAHPFNVRTITSVGMQRCASIQYWPKKVLKKVQYSSISIQYDIGSKKTSKKSQEQNKSIWNIFDSTINLN